MFSRLSALSVLTVALLAVATPNPENAKRWGSPPPTTTTSIVTTTITVTETPSPSEPASSCSTGPIQCCNSVQSASSPAATTLLRELGIVVQGVGVLVGLTCSPITVIGVGGSGCSAQTVCCQDNAHGGLISIGCVPVTL